MSEPVRLDIEDGVATLTMDQPDRMNPLTTPVSEGIKTHLDTIEGRQNVRCVVVEGAGEAFSAGGDVQQMKDWMETDEPLYQAVDGLEQGLNETMLELVGCSYPTVAKVDGAAVGAGANLAIACDIALASESASIGFVFKQVGLSVDGGTSYLLPRIVGVNKAKELVFTGEILGAREAGDLGLFNHVYPDDEFETQAAELVTEIARGPTVALGRAKRLIETGPTKTLEQALYDEAAANGVVYDSDDHREGVDAFLANREPQFEGK